MPDPAPPCPARLPRLLLLLPTLPSLAPPPPSLSAYLLRASHNEVPPRVQGALPQLRQLRLVLVVQHAPGGQRMQVDGGEWVGQWELVGNMAH